MRSVERFVERDVAHPGKGDRSVKRGERSVKRGVAHPGEGAEGVGEVGQEGVWVDLGIRVRMQVQG